MNDTCVDRIYIHECDYIVLSGYQHVHQQDMYSTPGDLPSSRALNCINKTHSHVLQSMNIFSSEHIMHAYDVLFRYI